MRCQLDEGRTITQNEDGEVKVVSAHGQHKWIIPQATTEENGNERWEWLGQARSADHCYRARKIGR